MQVLAHWQLHADLVWQHARAGLCSWLKFQTSSAVGHVWCSTLPIPSEWPDYHGKSWYVSRLHQLVRATHEMLRPANCTYGEVVIQNDTKPLWPKKLVHSAVLDSLVTSYCTTSASVLSHVVATRNTSIVNLDCSTVQSYRRSETALPKRMWCQASHNFACFRWICSRQLRVST